MSQLSKVLRDSTDHGLMFNCPGCGIVHIVHYGDGDGPRWIWNGDIDKPTFTPSILLRYHTWIPPATRENMNVGPQTKINVVCHSLVINGQIQFLNDCTHKLVGQTVDLPEWN
jgi:hypothetical protein